MKRIFFLFFLLLLGPLRLPGWDDRPALPPGDLDGVPRTELRGEGDLRAVVMHPDAERGFYRGRRFVSAGIVSRLSAAGHDFIGEGEIHTLGLACEFETPVPLPPCPDSGGARILKIGVGSFTLPAEHPRPERDPRPETPALWTRQALANGFRYRQEFSHPSGFAYVLTKEVLLPGEPGVLHLRYRLENRGAHPLVTNHYVHNFFRLDGVAVGPEIELELPFDLEPRLLESKFRNGARLEGARVRFDPVEELNHSATWLVTEPSPLREENRSILRNLRSGARVTVEGDWAPVQHKIYATPSEFCPEHFLDIRLAPGESRSWSVMYRFEREIME